MGLLGLSVRAFVVAAPHAFQAFNDLSLGENFGLDRPFDNRFSASPENYAIGARTVRVPNNIARDECHRHLHFG